MINNNCIKSICIGISTFFFFFLCILYFYPLNIGEHFLEFLRNLCFSIFGSSLIAAITAHIFIRSTIKEINICISIKLVKAYYILKNPTSDQNLHACSVQILEDNYNKVQTLIFEIFDLIAEFELKNNSSLPTSSTTQILQAVTNIHDASCILRNIITEKKSAMNHDTLSELWKILHKENNKVNENIVSFLTTVYNRKSADIYFAKFDHLYSENRIN